MVAVASEYLAPHPKRRRKSSRRAYHSSFLAGWGSRQVRYDVASCPVPELTPSSLALPPTPVSSERSVLPFLSTALSQLEAPLSPFSAELAPQLAFWSIVVSSTRSDNDAEPDLPLSQVGWQLG